MLWFRLGVLVCTIISSLIAAIVFACMLVMIVKPANPRSMSSDPLYNNTLIFYIIIMLTQFFMTMSSIFGLYLAFRIWRNNYQLDHKLRRLFSMWLSCLVTSILTVFIVGILGMVRIKEPQEELMSLFEIFSKYNQDVTFVGAFEKYQRENSCCGINGPDDWMMATLKTGGGTGSSLAGAVGGLDSFMGSPSTGKCHLTPPTIPMGCGKKLLEEIYWARYIYSGILLLETLTGLITAALGWYCFFYWIEKEVIIIPEDEVSNLIVIEPESSTSDYSTITDASAMAGWSRSHYTLEGSRDSTYSKPYSGSSRYSDRTHSRSYANGNSRTPGSSYYAGSANPYAYSTPPSENPYSYPTPPSENHYPYPTPPSANAYPYPTPPSVNAYPYPTPPSANAYPYPTPPSANAYPNQTSPPSTNPYPNQTSPPSANPYPNQTPPPSANPYYPFSTPPSHNQQDDGYTVNFGGFKPNTPRPSKYSKFSNFNGAIPSVGGPHSGFLSLQMIDPNDMPSEVADEEGTISEIPELLAHSISQVVTDDQTVNSQTDDSNAQSGSNGESYAQQSQYRSYDEGSNYASTNVYGDESFEPSSFFSDESSARGTIDSQSIYFSGSGGGNVLPSGKIRVPREKPRKKVKKIHSFNYMLHKQEKALGGRVLAEMRIDHKRDPESKMIEMETSHVRKGHRAHHATLAVVKNRKPPKPQEFFGRPEKGHGQTGHLATDILAMSGGAGAVKSMIDNVILPVEHNASLTKGPGYLSKLRKKKRGLAEHPDKDRPGHGPINTENGVMTAPSADGSQAQILLDSLFNIGPPKRHVEEIKPHEPDEDIDPNDVPVEHHNGTSHQKHGTGTHSQNGHHHHKDHHSGRSHHDHNGHDNHSHGHRSHHIAELEESHYPGSLYSGTHNPASLFSGTHNPASLFSGTHNPASLFSGTHNPASHFSGSRNPASHFSGSRNPASHFSGSRNPGSLSSGPHNPGSLSSGPHNPVSHFSGSRSHGTHHEHHHSHGHHSHHHGHEKNSHHHGHEHHSHHHGHENNSHHHDHEHHHHRNQSQRSDNQSGGPHPHQPPTEVLYEHQHHH